MRPSHSLLLGLLEDDHPQYYDESRLATYLGANPPVPAAHTHLEAEITDLKTYSEPGHTHVETDITDLGSYALSSHLHTGVYAPDSHTHSYVPLAGGTMTGSLYNNASIPIRLNRAGNQEIYKEGSGHLYIENRNEGQHIYFRTYKSGWKTRMYFAGDTRLYDVDGGNGLIIDSTNSFLYGDGIHMRKKSGTAIWKFQLDTSGDSYYKMETGESAATYLAWDTTNNRWLMTIGSTIVLRLSEAATRFPQVYTDTVATGAANVMVSSDGRLRRIVTPS